MKHHAQNFTSMLKLFASTVSSTNTDFEKVNARIKYLDKIANKSLEEVVKKHT